MTKTLFFGDKNCVNFTQLSNGHWVGETLTGTFTSVESFEKDSKDGNRFRDLECRVSTKEEEDEHEKILGRK